jgi:hypothetical protein
MGDFLTVLWGVTLIRSDLRVLKVPFIPRIRSLPVLIWRGDRRLFPLSELPSYQGRMRVSRRERKVIFKLERSLSDTLLPPRSFLSSHEAMDDKLSPSSALQSLATTIPVNWAFIVAF